ncbi:MAG: hypothetical protein RIS47_2228, partial [Bacteroidota bacterium]
YFPYIRPQENGNKTEVRWVAITNKEGAGLLFVGEGLLEASAFHNRQNDFQSEGRSDGGYYNGKRTPSRHTTDVVAADLTSVHIDYKQIGVGGDNSWGAWTHPEYRLTQRDYSYGYIIRPLSPNETPAVVYKKYK